MVRQTMVDFRFWKDDFGIVMYYVAPYYPKIRNRQLQITILHFTMYYFARGCRLFAVLFYSQRRLGLCEDLWRICFGIVKPITVLLLPNTAWLSHLDEVDHIVLSCGGRIQVGDNIVLSCGGRIQVGDNIVL